MNNHSDDSAGYYRPRPTEDAYVMNQYAELGLSEAPSLEEISPHTLTMMREKKILEGMGLALGRRIGSEDVENDAELRDITLLALRDPEQAFGGLLLKFALEELDFEG